MILAWETEQERQLAVIDQDIVECRYALTRLANTEAVSAEHAVRRAELAQRVRENLDWLIPVREEMASVVVSR